MDWKNADGTTKKIPREDVWKTYDAIVQDVTCMYKKIAETESELAKQRAELERMEKELDINEDMFHRVTLVQE